MARLPRYFIVNEGESLLRPQDSNLDQEVPDKRAHSVPMRFTRVGSGYLAAMDVMDVL